MDNFTYYAPTRYVFGTDAQARVGEMTREHLGDTVLIVSGHGSAERSGLLPQVRTLLREHAVVSHELTGIYPNPTDGPVRRGIALCRERGVTGILAVGGGSVIDTAKAIAAGVPYAGDFWDFWAGRAVVEKALPVGVVLTIPAAGSEGSGNSVITNTATNSKISLRTDHWLRPRFALMNPELTFTLPPYQTACGIVDMMAHILERYFSPTRNVQTTDRLSEGLLIAIKEQARCVMADPTDYDARANIMWAATMAHNGICGCGRREDWVSHYMEHELSAVYGIAHGAGLAIVLPAFLQFVGHVNPTKVAQLGRRVFGVSKGEHDRPAARLTVERMRDFFSSLGMPVYLEQAGIHNPDIDALVAALHRNKGDLIGSYHRLKAKDTAKIYSLMSAPASNGGADDGSHPSTPAK